VPLVADVMRSRPSADWQERLRRADVPHAPVWNYAALFGSPQAQVRGLSVTVRDPEGRPVELIGSPFHIGGAAAPAPTAPPGLGQHTDEVLRTLLGIDKQRLAELRQQGVI
jgi:formyl-CoA transferase